MALGMTTMLAQGATTGYLTLGAVQASVQNGFGDGPGRDGDPGWWILFPIGMMLFWGAVILTIVWMVTQRRRSGWGGPPGGWRGGGPGGPGGWGPAGGESAYERAQVILAERLARGEIDGAEYRERLSQLQPGGSGTGSGAGTHSAV